MRELSGDDAGVAPGPETFLYNVSEARIVHTSAKLKLTTFNYSATTRAESFRSFEGLRLVQILGMLTRYSSHFQYSLAARWPRSVAKFQMRAVDLGL